MGRKWRRDTLIQREEKTNQTSEQEKQRAKKRMRRLINTASFNHVRILVENILKSNTMINRM